MAPIIPFMTEYIWQNLVRKYQPDAAESVHLAGFPQPGAIDRALLDATAAARDVIATALKLRNERQIKVRQPLSALYLHKAHENELAPYLAVMRDELNVKEIVFLEDTSRLEDQYLQLNFKVAGRTLKGDLQKVKGLLDGLSDEEMAAATAQCLAGEAVTVPGYETPVAADQFNVLTRTKPHIAAHITDKAEELVALDATITDDLRAEGLYRDLLRNCQVLRREAGFPRGRPRAHLRDDRRGGACRRSGRYRADIERETLSTLSAKSTCPLWKRTSRSAIMPRG